MTAIARSDPFVGRQEEVGRLKRLVRAVAAGRGGSVWVEGEPGIGKSALLEVGLADAEQSGCQVFRAAADELGQRFPLRVLLDCLAVGPRSVDAARREIAAMLQASGPAGAARSDPLPAVTERLLAVVDRLCAAAPVLLVVDDVQWADEASLLAWHRLRGSVRQLPLLLVAACRPVPRRAELVALRRSHAASDVIMIQLGPLAAAAVVELAGGLVRAASLGPGLRRVLERAGGNPFYLRELIDALAREGRVRTERGAAELAGQEAAGVPRSLAAAISDRLGFVSGPTLGMLRAAALLGADFSMADLSAVVGRPAVELAGAIEEAFAAGVLAESGPRLAFRHVLIRQALYEATPLGLRLALHQQAARALAGVGAAVVRVAEQLLAALPDADTARTVDRWVPDWLCGPGRALTYRSPQVAAELLDRVIEALPGDDARREELQADLATVLVPLGRREEAVSLAERVLAVTTDPVRADEMSWTVALALLRMHRLEQARAALDRALRRPGLGRTWAVRLRALVPLVAALAVDSAEAVGMARQALAEAESVADGLAAGYAANALCGALAQQSDTVGALAAAERGLAALGDDPQTADLRLLLLNNRMVMLGTLDRMAEATAAARELLVEADTWAAPSRLAAVRCGTAQHYYHAGMWDDALAELEAVVDASLPAAPLILLLLHGIWALVAGHRDDRTTAEAHLRAAADQPSPPGPTATMAQGLVMARALLAERSGRPDAALATLTVMLDAGRPEELNDRLLWLPDAVRLALAVDDPETASRAAAASVADATAEPLPSRTAAAEHCAGLLDADPSRLLAAADTYRGVGRPVQLAQALEDAAVMLAGHGDVPAARAAYAEAAGIYHGLGAEWDLLRAETRLRPYHIRRSGTRRRPATGWDALTSTELTVARLVGTGRSNPDIAAELFLSRRTVETHVSHILAKLGARSRIEIAHAVAAH